MDRLFLPHLFLAIILVTLHCPAAPGAEPAPSPPSITVEAEGQVMATPDMATLTLEVETQAPLAQAAAAANARQSEELLKALKKTMGPEEKVQSLGYFLTPRRSRKDKTRPAEIIGYQASHRFQVKIRDLGRLGVVIDTSLKNGASQIRGPFWGHSGLEELKRQAAVDALRRAQALAQALAQAAGLKIKGLKKISTASRIIPPRPRGEVFLAAQAAPPTPIEVGEEEIRAHIQAEFELTP
jgi:uncharacterized protein YggE